jgi:hypothetical protein
VCARPRALAIRIGFSTETILYGRYKIC